MVTVCAWCERFLGPGEAAPLVTHGICAPCAARQRWADSPLIVVSHLRADLVPVLQHLLQGEPPVRVVLDRRGGERRGVAGGRGADPERRRDSDRRRRRADAFLI
jgi:hypothetical protein